jgi:hypothetical protein
MDSTDKDFSPQESLQLIRSMIETTRNSMSDSSHYYLLWGWATMIGCLIQYFLLVVVKYEHHYFAWFITPVALLVHFIFIYRDHKKEKVKTFISDATGYLWMILGFSYFALSFVFAKIGWQYCFPFYIMLYAIGTYISGSLISFKPMAYGGAACLLLVVITPYLRYEEQILSAAFAILISYIIPGHLLRNHYRKKVI